jgi:hypothetical protein
MTPALEVLADHLARLDWEETVKVIGRALEYANDRSWRERDNLEGAIAEALRKVEE